MLEQSIDEQKCLLQKLIEDYELSENPTPEILKSMKSVFSPYKNLGAFYEMNWHLISPILSRASWLEWLSETERENLYYHQLRTDNGNYIHNEYEFSLLFNCMFITLFIILLLITPYIYLLISRFSLKSYALIKNALILAVTRPLITISNILILLFCMILFEVSPGTTILFASSIFTFLISYNSKLLLNNLEELSN